MSTTDSNPGPAARVWQDSRAVRRMVTVGLALMVLIGLALLYLLTQATNNREMYEQYYAELVVLNVLVAVLLLLGIAWIGWRLWRRLRQGRFGSRLLLKLAAVFALAGFAPGLLIYVVSYQFVSRSIETWFDVQVEGALEAGVGLGRSTLDTLSSDLAAKTRVAAAQLQDAPDVMATLTLERLREQVGGSELLLWGATGQLLASAGQTSYQINPERPSAQQFRAARSQRPTTWIEGLDDIGVATESSARIMALVQVPGSAINMLGDSRFLQVVQTLPPNLVANAKAVIQAHGEYQERALARQGLRRMYIGTLTLSLFLAVFGAVLLAVILGNQITRPLLLLAAGMRQVAAGDLRPITIQQSKDELGGLTRSFADMTQQLADARHEVERSMQQVDASRSHLQTILDNLTAGVILLDEQGVIRSVNPGATRVLRLPIGAFLGHPLREVGGLEDFGRQVQDQFNAFLADRSGHAVDHWQQSFELGSHGPLVSGSPISMASRDEKSVITLVVRGAVLPGGDHLLVLDDISEIVSAQRAQAWAEVARRLAHEIKNPLTPIQLSAERMEMKLSDKLAQPEQSILTKSVKTIVDQVDAMKRLVNEFRDYARLPTAELKALNLNDLITDVLQLYGPDNRHVPVKTELDPECPAIRGDAQQLRQVLHNLLQNAQDASEAIAGAVAPGPNVLVRTQWLSKNKRVRLSVLDSGPGFPQSILQRAFEPYVTTKAKGTGLGLAVVKKIADEHGARIELSNRVADGQVQGAQVSLSFAVETTGPDQT